MGKRGRRQGVTNAAVRVARAAWREQDDELAEIAQRVYVVGRELKDSGVETLPLSVMAPLMTAAELSAPGMLRMAKLPVTEADALDAAAYLVAGFREMVVMLDPAHFAKWREATEAGESPAV